MSATGPRPDTLELWAKFEALIAADLKSATKADPLYAALTAEESMKYLQYVYQLSKRGEIENRIAQRDGEIPDKKRRYTI